MQDIPKTQEQKEYEELAQTIVMLLAKLTAEERRHIFNYIVFMYNK